MRRRTYRPPHILLLAVMLLLGDGRTVVKAAAIPPGDGAQTALVNSNPLQVYTYRPEGCLISGVLLVFHGLGRNAEGYRDDAALLGQRLCMLVVAPLFDKLRFPTWRYQRGGIVDRSTVQPVAGWTVNLLPPLIAWVRTQENRPDLPYALIGHSGGGQFLSRVAAFVPLAATRIVIANPSTWVLPTLDIPAPYGFGGVYPQSQAEDALRRYLAAPITVLLGQNDTGSHDLADSMEAQAQGGTRLARGQNAFRDAAAAAMAHGWPFNWRLALVPGVGHTARGMFASAQAVDALRP